MRDILSIFIHCADTPNGSTKFTVRDIDAWHAARGFRRDEEHVQAFNAAHPYIGYHEVIDVHGRAWSGRGDNEVGAHAGGHNSHSLSACLMGTNMYTIEQWATLRAVVQDWQRRYGDVRVRGHREVNAHKECPGFSVVDWVLGGMQPLPGHVL